MKYKTNEALIRLLKENYETACNAYLIELYNMWDWSWGNGYWAADDVGGIYCYGDDTFIKMDEIIYCVENDLSKEEFMKWFEYSCWCTENGFNTVNLHSWHHGAPVISKETRKAIDDRKRELRELIEETKRKSGY